MYYIYILRCTDNSLYTGITTDIKRRFNEHLKGEGIGAKYTRSRKPQSIEAVWTCETRSDASKLESAIKKLTKIKKEELIKNPSIFNAFMIDKLDILKYKYTL